MVKRYGPLDDPSVRTKSLVILSDVHCSCVCVITAHPVMSSAVLSVTTRDFVVRVTLSPLCIDMQLKSMQLSLSFQVVEKDLPKYL